MTRSSTKSYRPPFCAILALFLSTPAFATSEARLESAYRSTRGELIAIVAGDHGKSVFWGNQAELHQLEVLGQSPTQAETTIAFYRGLGGGKELSGEVEIDATGARVECDPRDGTEGFAPLEAGELRALEKAMRKRETKVTGPSNVLQPLYLFESGKELVLVMSPVFDFKGDFRVLMGPKGRLKPVSVEHSSERASEAQKGHIRFSHGGGIYIPLTIDLMGREGNRGSPTLIRTEGAPMEPLSMPHLTRAEIERLGFGKPIRAPLFNPCDRGKTAVVGPRSL